MHFLLGSSRMESGDYTGAVRSFESARAQMRIHKCEVLSLVSLVSFLPTISQCIAIDLYV